MALGAVTPGHQLVLGCKGLGLQEGCTVWVELASGCIEAATIDWSTAAAITTGWYTGSAFGSACDLLCYDVLSQ